MSIPHSKFIMLSNWKHLSSMTFDFDNVINENVFWYKATLLGNSDLFFIQKSL